MRKSATYLFPLLLCAFCARGADVSEDKKPNGNELAKIFSEAPVPDGTNKIITIANFTRIRKFILDQGKQQTYCNMFNDNPWWEFPKFNSYLNPTDESNTSKIGKTEFNTLVIRIKDGGQRQYWDVNLSEKKKELRIYQHYYTVEPEVLIKEVTEFFRQALDEIDRMEKEKQSNLKSPEVKEKQ
jgi:hypothetical protein